MLGVQFGHFNDALGGIGNDLIVPIERRRIRQRSGVFKGLVVNYLLSYRM